MSIKRLFDAVERRGDIGRRVAGDTSPFSLAHEMVVRRAFHRWLAVLSAAPGGHIGAHGIRGLQ